MKTPKQTQKKRMTVAGAAHQYRLTQAQRLIERYLAEEAKAKKQSKAKAK